MNETLSSPSGINEQVQSDEQLAIKQTPTTDSIGKTAVGRIDNVEEARAMAEGHDTVYEETREVKESEDWQHYSESAKTQFLEQQEAKAASIENWAGALHRLPNSAKSTLNYIGEVAKWQVQELAPLGRTKEGEVTPQDLSVMEEKIRRQKNILEKDDADISKRTLLDQARTFKDRLSGRPGEFIPAEYTPSAPESVIQAIDELANDPNATLKDVVEFNRLHYKEHGIKSLVDDIEVQERLLELIEGGSVPQLEELEHIVPDNKGLIAQKIKRVRERRRSDLETL